MPMEGDSLESRAWLRRRHKRGRAGSRFLCPRCWRPVCAGAGTKSMSAAPLMCRGRVCFYDTYFGFGCGGVCA